VYSLKPQRWRLPLVQKKYQQEKACDKKSISNNIINNNNNNNKFVVWASNGSNMEGIWNNLKYIV